MPDTGKLLEAAMGLRGSAPDVWVEFLKALDEYSAEVSASMLSSPIESLQRAQGMALSINELTQLLMNAPKAYDKLQAAKMGKRDVRPSNHFRGA